MSYGIAIKTALICFPILLILLFLPYIIREYHKYGSVYWYRGLILFSFILYLMVAYFLVILPLPTMEEVMALDTPRTRFIPFAFVTDFFKESGFVLTDFSTYFKAFTSSSFYVPFFNILLFIPFGVYLHYYFKWDLKKTTIASFFLSLFFELTQLSGLYFIYPRGYRLFDIDDLLLNTFGGFLGYFLGTFFLKFLPSRDEIDQKSLTLANKVSVIRRGLAYTFDFLLISIFCGIIHSEYPVVWYIGYFGGLPILLKGQTLMEKFFHLKIVHENKEYTPWYSYSLRYLLMNGELVFLPFLLVWLYRCFLDFFGSWQTIGFILLLSGIFFYYGIIFLKMLFSKKLLYEKVSQTTIINTLYEIKEK